MNKTTDIKQQTAKATRWSSFTEIVARLVLPVINMILARLLTPDAFGVVATVTMVVSFAEIFSDAGFQKYLIQHDFRDTNDLNNNTNVAFWTNLGISLLIWSLIWIFDDRLAVMVGNPGLGMVISIASLSVPLNAFSSIQMARYKRDFDFKTLFYIRLISICIPLVVTIPLAIFTRSYWALVIGTLAGNLVNAIVLTWRSQWKPKLYYSWKQLKEMFAFSWWILLESITTWMASYADTFIVGLYLSSYFIGLYKTSMITVNQIMGIITAATSMPLFVALTKYKNDKKLLENCYNEYMQAISLLALPMSAGIWIFRETITMILLGSQWLEASNFIGLWGGLTALTLIFGTYANGLYNAVGKTYLSFAIGVINVLLMIPVLLIFTPRGFEALYISRSMLRIAFIVIQSVILVVTMKFPLGNLICRMLPSLLCTVIMGAAGYALLLISDTLVWQIVSILVCMLVYFAATYLLFPRILEQSLDILGVNVLKLIKRKK